MPTHKQIERYLLFVFGLIFVSGLLVIALKVKQPTVFQWYVFRVVLGLSAAGVAAFIPGFLEVKVSTFLRASGAIAVFIVIYFFEPASLVSEKPNQSLVETQVLSRKQDVLILRGTWEAWTPRDKMKVAANAPLLGQAILAIPDEELRAGFMITKYQYASYAFLMACESEPDYRQSESYCMLALEHGTKYLDIVRQVDSSASESEYNSEVADWARETRQLDRANYQLALTYGVLFRINGEVEQRELARQFYAKISPLHKQEHPMQDSKILWPILQENVANF